MESSRLEQLPGQGTGAAPSIDADRLLRRIAELAVIGSDRAGGITRTGFSAADRDGRCYLIAQAVADNLTPVIDPAGNILIRRSGAPAGKPMLLMGSHLDTVVNGGRLDGAYGVLAAVQVLTALPAGSWCEPVAVVFANEEGALYPQPFWGSMAFAGQPLPEDASPQSGLAPLADAIALAGGDMSRIAEARCPDGAVAAYLELHIEQGTVLERAGARIGVVDGITGRSVLTLRIRGEVGHAGTRPMEGRHDSLVAAAHAILAVQEIALGQRLCRTATVGRVEPFPNTPNTIAQEVHLTVDIRDVNPGRIAAAESALRREIAAIAERTGTEIAEVAAVRAAPAPTAPALRAEIEHSARTLGLPSLPLPSGAGHDAQMIAAIAPVGMIFVPSIGGISHAPAEDTAAADLVAGAEVLLLTALRIMGRPAGYQHFRPEASP